MDQTCDYSMQKNLLSVYFAFVRSRLFWYAWDVQHVRTIRCGLLARKKESSKPRISQEFITRCWDVSANFICHFVTSNDTLTLLNAKWKVSYSVGSSQVELFKRLGRVEAVLFSQSENKSTPWLHSRYSKNGICKCGVGWSRQFFGKDVY